MPKKLFREFYKTLWKVFSLPGLDFDSIVNNLIEKRYVFLKELSPSERQKREEEIIEYYNTTASDEINSNIAKIKKSYSSINNQIITLQEVSEQL